MCLSTRQHQSVAVYTIRLVLLCLLLFEMELSCEACKSEGIVTDVNPTTNDSGIGDRLVFPKTFDGFQLNGQTNRRICVSSLNPRSRKSHYCDTDTNPDRRATRHQPCSSCRTFPTAPEAACCSFAEQRLGENLHHQQHRFTIPKRRRWSLTAATTPASTNRRTRQQQSGRNPLDLPEGMWDSTTATRPSTLPC